MRYVVWGFWVWFAATAVFRVAGEQIIKPNDPVGLTILFAATAPLMLLLMWWVYRQLRVPPGERLRVAALLVLPGMLLDVGSTLWFPVVFPNMPAGTAVPFAALLLWAYALALASGLWRGRA